MRWMAWDGGTGGHGLASRTVRGCSLATLAPLRFSLTALVRVVSSNDAGHARVSTTRVISPRVPRRIGGPQ
ncbi:MAG: hypothetical protein JWM10_1581 [Myxococcaceae bacterium]|nr:hypothetical protein [Myxococcaceae bacterium]